MWNGCAGPVRIGALAGRQQRIVLPGVFSEPRVSERDLMHDEGQASEIVQQSRPCDPAISPLVRPRIRASRLMICAAIAGIVLAVWLHASQIARRASWKVTCSNQLKQIGFALWSYHAINRAFPCAISYSPEGTPMCSWRVAVLPYLHDNPIYDRYDFREAWNGPHNGLIGDDTPDTFGSTDGTPISKVYDPWYYRCPSSPRSQNRMCTNYVMLIDDRHGKPNGPPNRPGSVPPCFDDKSAVIVLEIADSDIHWMEPRDVLLSELSMKINDRTKRSLSSYHGGACVVHADGSVEILDEATTEERLRELLAH